MQNQRVITRMDQRFLDEFDSFMQKQPFRHLHVKLSLDYYNNFMLLIMEIPRDLLEWLYADLDMFLASWMAEGTASLRQYQSNFSELPGFGFVLLGSWSPQLLFIYKEDQLVLASCQYTVTVAILNLPETRLERKVRTETLLQEFEDYLSSREFKMYFKETFRDTVKTVQASAPCSTATLGLSSTVSTLGHATAGFALTLAVDVAVTIHAVSKARKLHKAGEITDKEFKTTVKRKVRQTSCQLVGGSTGSMIGQIVIPVPVVGAMIGGFVGSLIGTGLSKGMDKIEEVRDLKKPAKGLTTRGESSSSQKKTININDSFKNIRSKLQRNPRKSEPTSP